MPTLQQPTIKVPLENLQLNAGIIKNNKGVQLPVTSKSGLYMFESQEEFNSKKGLMISGDYATVKISDSEYLFYKVIEDGSIQECSKEEIREYKISLIQNK